MEVAALKWIGDVDGFLELIDQRRLPVELVKLQCQDIGQVCEAIKTLAVRGAPAIGVTAAYGLVLGMQKLSEDEDLQQGLSCLTKSCEYLGRTRPTAVNLFWAMERIKRSAEQFVEDRPKADLQELKEKVLADANAIYAEDVDMCRRIGENGQRFIKQGAGVLTHCNTGALATADQGTALSVIFEAHKEGKKFVVYVDETRPLLQGARLTAWELKQAGIDVVVICDNMAGWLMKQGKINLVLTGADRIVANGDAANKIGTYSLSILARENDVPLYIAAPSSTFDLSIENGAEIPIEQRSADEVRFIYDRQIAPDGVGIYNPAFDVTDAQDIAAIITERGVIEAPNAEKIEKHLQ
ncbi:MAG: S-methyl-5-thioribose-1-phosphate isomerase [Planctomycetota bacterium]|jgi:methylthioribose-1-phosphate isomerase